MSPPQVRPQASPASAEMQASPASPEAIAEFAVRRVRDSVGRTVVEIVGEVDYDCVDDFDRALTAALDGLPGRRARSVELDLTGLAFCDCSGLNALLRLRQRAAAVGCGVRVIAVSPQVSRLFDTTGTRQFFTGSVNGGAASVNGGTAPH